MTSKIISLSKCVCKQSKFPYLSYITNSKPNFQASLQNVGKCTRNSGQSTTPSK